MIIAAQFQHIPNFDSFWPLLIAALTVLFAFVVADERSKRK